MYEHNEEDLACIYSQNCTTTLQIKNFHKNSEPFSFAETMPLMGGIFIKRVQIYLSPCSLKNKSHISVGIKIVSEITSNIFSTPVLCCDTIISILDRNGNRKLPRRFQFLFNSENTETCSEEEYIDRSFILNEASEFLHQNTLAIIAEATISEWVIPQGGFIPVLVLYDSLAGLEIENHEDELKIYLQRNSFHNFFLRSESEYFRRVWEVDMTEKERGYLIIRKEDISIFVSMLKFIEQEILHLESISIFELYGFANQYLIESLLKICREFLKGAISKETASYILDFANSYDDIELRTAVETFFGRLKVQECSQHVEKQRKLGKSSNLFRFILESETLLFTREPKAFRLHTNPQRDDFNFYQ